MPRHSSNPVIFEHCLTISTKDLKRWGYLPPSEYKKGIVYWRVEDHINLCLLIYSDIEDGMPCIFLDYQVNEKKLRTKILLKSLPSNLGSGKVWLMRCPITANMCRKLHFYKLQFIHRKAIPLGYYEQQVVSGRVRSELLKFLQIMK